MIELSKLNYEGYEILRTTDTGIKINWKAPKWRIALAYLKYVWYSIAKWIDEGPGPTDNNA
jgi:hypothetical protein